MTRWVDRAFEAIIIVLFIALVVAGTLQITNRFVFNVSLSWTEEFQKYAHVWLVYMAIPVAYNRGAHIGVDILLNALPKWPRRTISALISAGWLVLAGVIVITTMQVMKVAAFQTTPGLGISMANVYAGMVVGGGYLAFCVLRNILIEVTGGTPMNKET